MSLFQKSVINKYLKNLDDDKVNNAFENFKKLYGNKLRLHNIMQLKEENYQEGFLREIFVETLGYTINPDENYNLTTEYKNQKDSRKADGAILLENKAIGVIELKSTKTKNLESIKEQAFSYKNNQPGCQYVITSNFQSLRFYVDDATEYEEFNLFELAASNELSPRFKLFYLLLSKESIFSNLPDKLKKETKFHENNISDKLYKDYKHFKGSIFESLVKNNPHYDKLILFKKSQKLLDRFLFVLFAEDGGLIPPNAISKIIEQWKQLQELDEYKPLYTRFQKLFSHLDKGHKYKEWGEIPAYNGGLFREDEILDSPNLKIDDDVLLNDSKKLTAYDFNTEVDVNILGHIFEHSLSEIEDMEKTLSVSESPDNVELSKPKTSKRKKDGIFYTPKYITKYIVENTVGALCKEKKEELQISVLLIDDSYSKKDGKLSKKGKQLFNTLNNYKNWLLTLKILDPACGSGAFLNQTLDFLIAEHKQTDDIIAELTGEAIRLFDTDKAILENNIYGVDINEESVEIAKLSLWLRTAQRGRPLSDLSGNIKCGNSLIDDPEIAGDKAFDWHKEFPQIFNPRQKKTEEKEIEEKPDYLDLIEKNAKLAQEKAEQSAKLSNEAITYSKKVYEYTKKQKSLAEEAETLYGVNKGGFDVVLGNPPYGANFKNNEKVYLKNRYSKIHMRTPESFNYFIYRIESIIHTIGRWGVIIPSSFLNQFEFEKGRKNIFEQSNLEKVLNLGDDVFQDVATPTCIIVVSKIIEKDTYYGDFQNINRNLLPIAINDSENLIIANDLKENDGYSFIVKPFKNLINKCNEHPKLKEITEDVATGISPGLGKAFIKTIDEVKTLKLENELIKKLIIGGEINRYFLNPISFKHIIYATNKTKIEHYPKIHRELTKYNEKLNQRVETANGSIKWYVMLRPRRQKLFEKEKILIRQTANKIIASYDKEKWYCLKSSIIIQLPEETSLGYSYLLTVLNSKLMNFIYQDLVGEGSRIFPEVKPVQLLKLPIKTVNVETQQPFIQKADLMLSLNKELQSKVEKFIKRIKANLAVEKITNKLQSFYDFDFKTFIDELKKQKIKLSLAQQDEWEDYFDSYKKEINKLQQQINQTDNEIDKMVYELYGLTDEEIEIVENLVK